MDYLGKEFWNRGSGDRRVLENYPLLSSGPIPIVLIVGIYLYFVRVLGPRLMESRKAFDLIKLIRVYNLSLSFLGLYCLCDALPLTNYGLDYIGCKQIDQTHPELLKMGYIYFLAKVVELLDTVFFILRKKNQQASNLHVFHHSFMVICSWFYLKMAPGGSSVLFPIVNAAVHTVMYFYYFLATFKSAKRYLWWKRHLTEAQMAQFVLTMLHFASQYLLGCDYSTPLAVGGFAFNLFFLYLFCGFYYQTYLKPDAKQDGQSAAKDRKKEKHSRLHNLTTLFSIWRIIDSHEN